MKISLVINADSRAGWMDSFTGIKDHGDNSLCGCRSVDFMLAGVRNKLKFFDGHDLETILVIDERESIPAWVRDELNVMVMKGEITKLVIKKFDHAIHRWNCHLYCESIKYATGDYLVHFDGDAAAFRHPDWNAFEFYAGLLERDDCNAVCQQTPMKKEIHGMWWMSTRFFICKRATLDIEEAQRCIDDRYRRRKYPNAKHSPCAEHLFALVSGEKVLYPPADYGHCVVFSWVNYYRGVLEKLNAMSYEDAARYIFETCGGPLGASDLIGKPLP